MQASNCFVQKLAQIIEAGMVQGCQSTKWAMVVTCSNALNWSITILTFDGCQGSGKRFPKEFNTGQIDAVTTSSQDCIEEIGQCFDLGEAVQIDAASVIRKVTDDDQSKFNDLRKHGIGEMHIQSNEIRNDKMEAAGMYTGAKCSKETLVIVPNGLTWRKISSKDGHVKMLTNCQQCCQCNEMTLSYICNIWYGNKRQVPSGRTETERDKGREWRQTRGGQNVWPNANEITWGETAHVQSIKQ